MRGIAPKSVEVSLDEIVAGFRKHGPVNQDAKMISLAVLIGRNLLGFHGR